MGERLSDIISQRKVPFIVFGALSVVSAIFLVVFKNQLFYPWLAIGGEVTFSHAFMSGVVLLGTVATLTPPVALIFLFYLTISDSNLPKWITILLGILTIAIIIGAFVTMFCFTFHSGVPNASNGFITIATAVAIPILLMMSIFVFADDEIKTGIFSIIGAIAFAVFYYFFILYWWIIILAYLGIGLLVGLGMRSDTITVRLVK